jgi:hypothetical protein
MKKPLQKNMMIFPRCGITYGDIVQVFGMTITAAAHRIGIDRQYFSRRMEKFGLSDNFTKANRNQYLGSPDVFPGRGISREDVESCKGLLQIDAADILGVSQDHFTYRIRRDPELRKLFPAKGATPNASPGMGMHSFKDKEGKQWTACCECNRGGNGNAEDKCSCGWQSTEWDQKGCFIGTSIVGEPKKAEKQTRGQERYQRYLEYSDCFDSFIDFCRWDTQRSSA